MSQPQPIANVISQAIQHSLRLEQRRCLLTDFDVKRLAQEVSRAGNNALAAAVGNVLVGEMERDFPRVDAGAKRLMELGAAEELLVNLANTVLLAFNPALASTLSRQVVEQRGDSPQLLNHAMMNAWFTGDLALCRDAMQRLTALQAEYAPLFNALEINRFIRLLDNAGVTLNEYRQAIRIFYATLRSHLAHKRNVRTVVHLESVIHEDGYEGIVVEIMLAGLGSEKLDDLDDALLDVVSTPEQISLPLSHLMTFLVRDVTELATVQETG